MVHVCAHLHVVSMLRSVPVSMSLYCINRKLGMYIHGHVHVHGHGHGNGH
jgi:hypothetical protein